MRKVTPLRWIAFCACRKSLLRMSHSHSDMTSILPARSQDSLRSAPPAPQSHPDPLLFDYRNCTCVSAPLRWIRDIRKLESGRGCSTEVLSMAEYSSCICYVILLTFQRNIELRGLQGFKFSKQIGGKCKIYILEESLKIPNTTET